MGRYIDDILQPGEKVLYSTNAHWIFFLPAIGLWILSAVFLAMSGMVAPGSPLMLVCWSMAAIMALFALYKTLTVTIEMRHAPFFGWINDLSARDPTSIFNLFGLLPFDPGAIPLIGTFLLIGAWPILYGVSMWALQGLSAPVTDPVQKQIFGLLPFIFTILFASFAAGLVIYWTWSNILSILQQYVISRRQGVETQFDIFLRKRFGKKDEAEPVK